MKYVNICSIIASTFVLANCSFLINNQPSIPIPGYPNVEYVVFPETLVSYDPKEISACVTDFYEQFTKNYILTNQQKQLLNHALSTVEIDVVEHDFSYRFAYKYTSGVSAKLSDQKEECAGDTDAYNNRVIVSMKRPDGSIRSIGHSALAHELMHIAMFVLYNDPDENHSLHPGPWNNIDDLVLVDIQNDLDKVYP